MQQYEEKLPGKFLGIGDWFVSEFELDSNP